ncbi:exodeoxyribonuclease I [Crenothrix polyspora]|uniref:Exodeoxyribonuclease I n=1 Tax=Crenothrix polyspora TaxID=360316 RepID=A0A1R4GZW8_9GAMM|nr:exodeoxyribonuclease I [Crenothrix polyspora]SJM89537.1 Exodeoxyribonuclease I [Crenothrix polyspora]
MAEIHSFFWHDYETFGIDPQRDRPAQFAGIRTDADFNIINESAIFYCKPPADYLPQPDACVITGITPQLAEQRGVCEAEFTQRVHELFSAPNTCVLGYNTLRFDDEFTRNCLYRNFYDPYEREYKNGNSRWDIIDVVRAAKALRPDGIVWPYNEVEARPSFRLEELTKANNIAHEMAHDALSDVYATIAIAKLVKAAQPKLYQFLWQHRLKPEAINLLQFGSFKPVVHISGKYPARKNCLAIVLPVCRHPTNTNGVMVYDLSVDPEPMLLLSAEEIQRRIFTATADLPEGVERIPLKTVHVNKCPVLAPISVIRPEDAQRLGIDLALCQKHITKIQQASGLAEKLAAVFTSSYGESVRDSDPDLAIYAGGFFSPADRLEMAKIRSAAPETLATKTFKFADSRLPEMLFRYRARNFPATLNATEAQQWLNYCKARLTGELPGVSMTFNDYLARLEVLATAGDVDPSLLAALHEYVTEKIQMLG